MTSTATSNLRLELQGIGDNAGTWGTNLNTALQMLDRANGAYGDIAIVDGTNTITVTDYTNGDWHYKVWNLTGALTTAADVEVPTYNKFWYVVNSTTGSQVVTVKVSGQTGVVIPDGGWAIVYCDGTDVELVSNSSGAGVSLTGGTGVVAQTGTGTYAARTVTGTANEITATNGDGVAGNPTLSLPAALTFTGKTITGGTFSAPTISGGSVTGITDMTVADGGTGASTAAGARTNLGVAIGTDVQAYDAGLASIAGLTTLADRMIYTTASDTYAVATLTAAGRAILDDADASAQRTTLGLGTIATQSAASVSITGGSVTGITDITVADGGTGRSSHTAYALIAGGTTTTGPQQSIASVGTSGQVLTSNGAGALPTFQAVAGGGDFSGPASSTDNALVRFNGTGGKTGQNSGWTLSDAELLTAAGNQDFAGFDALNVGGTTFDTTDKGSVGSGTVTFTVSDDAKQKLTVTGALTIAFAGWPTTGNYAECEIELVNGGTNVTWPTVNWAVGDGTTSTTFADTGITLASSGTNHVVVWSTDGGTTLYGVAA
jgi:hypothetical protein